MFSVSRPLSILQNLSAIRGQYAHVHSMYNCIAVNGTTGEGANLTMNERKQIAEKWMECGINQLNTITVHVGGANIEESKELAEHAQNLGVSAVSAMPSVFFKPNNVESLVEYCRVIAACAPNLPFYYYHLPAFTGVDFNMNDFLVAAETKIPTLRGMKFSSRDLMDATQCKLYGDGKYQILFGCDEISLCALSLGIDDYIGSTYNMIAPIYYSMRAAYKEGRMQDAQRDMYKAQQAVKILFKYGPKTGGLVGALKAMMTLTGVDVGPPRLPLKPLDTIDTEAMKNELQNAGYFQLT